MTVFSATQFNKDGGQEVVALFAVVSITVNAGQTTASAAHGLGKTPTGYSVPNPSRDEGYNARASGNAITVTITLDAPVSQNTTYTVVCYGV